MSSYWNNYPELKKNIDETNQLIQERIQVRNKDIEAALSQLTAAGGKQLRPAFFYLFSQLGNKENQDTQQLKKIAASLEILHVATLIHDDVIDDSPLRRGNMTIQSKFGKDIAVYTGDLLFTVFFDLILESMADTPFMTINAKSMHKILMGELDQMHLRYNQQQGIHHYLRAISGKTAELFKLASKEGAYFGGAEKEVVRLAGHIGFNIGMTFQILDDILDYTADKKTFNKPVLEDLAQGVYSLPLLLAIEENPDIFKPILDKKTDMATEDMEKIAYLVVSHRGVDKARHLARKFTEKAISDINKLPQSSAKKQLLQLTNYLLKRKI